MSHEHGVFARRFLSGIAIMGVVAAMGSNAAAQAPNPGAPGAPDKKLADKLFKEGRAAFDKGDFAEACPRFEASFKADPTPGTLLNLGVCESRQGKLTSAHRRLKELMARLPPNDDRIPFAQDLLRKLEARIPQLTLTLAPGAPPDTKVVGGDGAPLATGTALSLDPGEYRLTITAADRAEAHVDVKLAEGQRESLTVAPGAAAAQSSAAAPAPANQGARLRRTLGFVAGGVGVAGFGVAAVSGALLLGKKSDIDAHCPKKLCDAEGLRLRDEAKKTPLLPLNTAGWIIGIAGVAAGAVLVATSFGGGEEKKTSASVLPIPWVFPGGGGVAATGAF